MDEDNKEFDNGVVKGLIWFEFYDVLLSHVFLYKLQKIAKKLKIKIPVFILFKDGGQEIFVCNKFKPGKCEVGVEERIDFVEFFGKNIVEGGDFFFSEIILFSGGITDEI